MNEHNFENGKNYRITDSKANNKLQAHINSDTSQENNSDNKKIIQMVDLEDQKTISYVDLFKVNGVNVQSHKILEDMLNKLAGVFIIYKMDHLDVSSNKIYTRAIVHEWDYDSQDDERGQELFLIQLEKDVKKKKQSWITKDQIIVKSMDNLNLCYGYNSKNRLGLYLALDDEKLKYPIHYSKEEKENYIMGNLKISGTNNGIRIYPKNERKQYILGMNDFGVKDGLNKHIYQKCTFESGTLGLFDGIGRYQCVSFPEELVWQERM